MAEPSAAPAQANATTPTKAEIQRNHEFPPAYLDQEPRICWLSGSSHRIFARRMKATATLARKAKKIINQRIPISESVAVLNIARLHSAGFICAFRASAL